jgi:hypothetical protein
MNNNQRRTLRIIALVVLLAAMVLLIYSLLPGKTVSEVQAIMPTYLIPPAVVP